MGISDSENLQGSTKSSEPVYLIVILRDQSLILLRLEEEKNDGDLCSTLLSFSSSPFDHSPVNNRR
jgi:hypothetical protein